MAAPFSIMCFAWNASGLKLCETMSQSKADAARTGFKAFITMKKPCITPDFFEGIRAVVLRRKPSLVVMSTEDEDSSDSYFHSDLLPGSMPEIGYTLLKRNKVAGVGGNFPASANENIVTGKPYGSALRMSIYARDDVHAELQMEERQISKFFGNDGQLEDVCNQGGRVSGAIGAYVWHPTYGKFLFIATRLASGLDAFQVGKNLDYDSYRVANRASNSLCLINIMNRFINTIAVDSRPDHIFLMGDLNYNIAGGGWTNTQLIEHVSSDISAAAMQKLQQYDELKWAKSEPPLLGFKEGVSDQGPLFMPNWPLKRNRDQGCVPTNASEKISPYCFSDVPGEIGGIGWHDRILYKEASTSNYAAHCLSYASLDINNMHASTNAGVMALFDMQPSI
jgi:hypothetical protein